MKLKLLLSASLFYSINLLAQNSIYKITYLDSLYKPTTETDYKYKEIISEYIPEQKGYEVKTYFKSGKLKRHAISGDKDRIMYIGTIKEYYENGQLEKIFMRSDMSSPTKEYGWYENGQKKIEAESYFDQKNHGFNLKVNQFWDKDGNQLVKDGNGIFEELLGNEYSKGSYVKGNKHGIWMGYSKEFNFTFTETYKKGRLISGISIDSDKNEHHYRAIEERPVMKIQNNMPLSFFIRKAISSFDPKSKIFNTESKITIFIDKNGKITKIETTPDINKEFPELISEIFEQYSEWIPSKYRGISVPYTETICATTNEVFINKGD